MVKTGRIFSIFATLVTLVLFVSCSNPATSNPTAESQLTVNWSVITARSIYPGTYPIPATYDVLLQSAGYADVTANGLTGGSWSTSNLSRVVWTITVTGRDTNGNVIVQGGSSVDLTTTASRTSTVILQYLHTGIGSGAIHLTLDLSASPNPIGEVTVKLTDPEGRTTTSAVPFTGYTASYTLDPAPVGSYDAFFSVTAGDLFAGKMENIMVFQNIDTANTLGFVTGDFDHPFRPVTGVSLDQSVLALFVNGAPATLVASIQPANASNGNLTWSSSNESVATVSQAGIVTPVGAGACNVTVATQEGSFVATCAVTVSIKHVTSVSITPANLTLNQEGSAGTLTAVVLPADASDASCTWSSDNTGVATVDAATGIVIPVAAGTANITVTTTDGAKTSSIVVTVIPNGQSSGTMSVSQPAANTVTISGSQYMPVSGTNPTYTGAYSGIAGSYQWYVDGVVATGATGTTFVPPTQSLGTHVLTLVVKDVSGLSYSGSRPVQVVTTPPNDITAFSFPSLGETATINGTEIIIYVPVGISITSLTASFISNGASVNIGGVDQVSGVTVNDFSTSLVYNVVSASGAIKNYNVSVLRRITPSVSAGGNHSMILKSDGSLWATGNNNFGQLGDGTTTVKLIPVQVMSVVASVSAGQYQSMILLADGGLWATGFNNYGQLGDGTIIDRYTPVAVTSGVAAVSTAGYHTMILKTDGGLWATGYNHFGQLGDGSTTDKHSPVLVMSGVASVSAGYTHTMILKTDGSLWATGSNTYGQLGDGTTTDKHSPVHVMDGVASVSAGCGHTMIIKADGSLWATGQNCYGQLGDGTITNCLSPVHIMDGVASVSAGSGHTMILKTDGSLWGTGGDNYGQLGDGTIVFNYKQNPILIMSGVASVSAGNNHTMILKADGSLWAAGYNYYGQLGDGATVNKSTPVRIY